MIISRKKLFLILNYIYFVGLLISLTNSPLGDLASKFKVVFILFCFIDLVYCKNIKWNKKVVYIALILISYMVLWSTAFANKTVLDEIKNHCILMTYYLLLLFLSYGEVNKYQCISEFIQSSYYACITVLFMQCILHFNELVKNPFYIFQAVFSNARVRSTFGFMHTNYLGNICFATLVLSYFMLKDYVSSGNYKDIKKRILYLILADMLCFFMLISTSCRSAITSLGVFILALYIGYLFKKQYNSNTLKIILIVTTIVFIIGMFLILKRTELLSYIWENSNRSLNVSANIPFVKEIGNIWTGMGFVENGAFQAKWFSSVGQVSAFGVSTSSLDMYYVYLFCTTGILGCIIIGGILIYMFCQICKNRNLQNKHIYIAMYISILYYGFWESVIFSYRFWTMLILTILMICAVGKVGQKERNI